MRSALEGTPTQEIAPLHSRPIAIAVGVVSLLLGMAISIAASLGAPRLVPEQILSVESAPSQLTVRYEGTSTPPPKEIELAEELLAQARLQLSARQIDDGERLLGICIRLADLAECHRVLAGVLALERRPGARAHLELYLERAADAPDRELLSSVLKKESK